MLTLKIVRDDSGEMKVSEIRNTSDIDFVFHNGLSFFDPYLRYFIREILEIGGEAYVSKSSEGAVSGIFIYDDSEKLGTIFTRSRESFDYLYELKPFNFIFSEMKTEFESEIYDIYAIELEDRAIVHRFSYEISTVEEGQIGEIERFMVLTHPGINRRWVNVALKNGDRCFVVRLGTEIAGLGWVSLVNGVGRLHSLCVKPQFRKIGIGEDIVYARLLWLKSKHASSAFSEISRYNFSSSRIAVKAQFRVSGEIFQYFKREPGKKAATERLANVVRF